MIQSHESLALFIKLFTSGSVNQKAGILKKSWNTLTYAIFKILIKSKQNPYQTRSLIGFFIQKTFKPKLHHFCFLLLSHVSLVEGLRGYQSTKNKDNQRLLHLVRVA